MSRHEGVSCDNCLTSNFQEKRFKCLICYDYDLCEICFDNNVSTSRHSPSHPMQCILTKRDFDLFYGGEGITMDNPPALTCPLCGKRGLTESNLQEHVNSQHLETNIEVVCPICAAIPAGEPNHVTDDFATHLAIEHSNSHRANVEEPMTGRPNMRRMFYPGRSVRGARVQQRSTMHFSSGPSTLVPGFNTVANAAASLPHSRDPYTDPIAELLSQLSGVRRSAQQLQQTVSTASQLQELQAQLQLERQRASLIRQQLERIPGKVQTSNGKQSTNQSANGQNKTYATAVKSTEKETSAPVSEDEDPRLLLAQIYDKSAEASSEAQKTDSYEQSLFVRELIYSLPVEKDSSVSADNESITPQPSAAQPRAIPIDCGKLSSSIIGAEAMAENGNPKQNDLPNIVSESDIFKSTDEVVKELETDELDNEQQSDTGAVGRTLSKADMSDHVAREVNDMSGGLRRSNSEEKSQHSPAMTDLKKDPSNLRSPSQYSSEASNVPGLVRSQSSHPVSSFPVLVSGATEQ